MTPDEISTNAKSVAGMRAWMKARGYNQRFIAERMDVSEATVSKWLSGRQNMTIAQFHSIAALIGAQPAELMGGPEQIARMQRYDRLARLAAEMSDDQLKALEGIAAQMAPRPREG